MGQIFSLMRNRYILIKDAVSPVPNIHKIGMRLSRKRRMIVLSQRPHLRHDICEHIRAGEIGMALAPGDHEGDSSPLEISREAALEPELRVSDLEMACLVCRHPRK
jgi:hypothetical protein